MLQSDLNQGSGSLASPAVLAAEATVRNAGLSVHDIELTQRARLMAGLKPFDAPDALMLAVIERMAA